LAATLWPSPRQERLLAVAFAPENQARTAWETVRAELDIDRLEDGSYAVMALVYRRLESWNDANPLVARFKSIYRHTWYRSNLLLEGLERVLSVAVGLGIPVVVAGPPRLLVRSYRDPGLRPSSRIDLIVPADRHTPLADALVRDGWEERSPRDRGAILWLQRGDALALALERGVEPETTSIELRDAVHSATTATTELVRTCIGPERHMVWNRLQWIADATFLLRNEGSDIDWDRALADSQHKRLLFRDAMLYARVAANAPVPRQIIDRLSALRPTTREALAHRVSRLDRDRVPRSLRRAIRKVIPAR